MECILCRKPISIGTKKHLVPELWKLTRDIKQSSICDSCFTKPFYQIPPKAILSFWDRVRDRIQLFFKRKKRKTKAELSWIKDKIQESGMLDEKYIANTYIMSGTAIATNYLEPTKRKSNGQ